MKKLLASLLLLLLLPVGGQAENYVTIQELRAETAVPWQSVYAFPEGESYLALHGDYTFAVDLQPRVPEVDAFPVLKLKLKRLDSTSADHSGLRLVLTSPGYERWFGDEIFYDELDAAEDNPLSPDDAAALAQALWQQHLGVDNIRVRGAVGFARAPRFFGEYANESVKRNTLSMGNYVVVGEQVFSGIPLLESCYCDDDGTIYPMLECRITLQDESRYQLIGCAMEQVGVAYEDVPLLPFARIREIYEQTLAARTDGKKLIHLTSAELGYKLVLAPDEPGNRRMDNVYLTQPVWILRGYRPEKSGNGSGKRLQYDTEKEQAVLRHPRSIALGTDFDLNASYMCIDAQTGQVLNEGNLGAFYLSLHAQIVTWP